MRWIATHAISVYAAALKVRRWIRDHVKTIDGLTATLQFDEYGGLTTFPRVDSVNESGALYDYPGLARRRA